MKVWRERVVPGARIELATPAFSGRRSTTELPRQWHRFEYFRERASLSQTFTHHDYSAAVTASIRRTLCRRLHCPQRLLLLFHFRPTARPEAAHYILRAAAAAKTRKRSPTRCRLPEGRQSGPAPASPPVNTAYRRVLAVIPTRSSPR